MLSNKCFTISFIWILKCFTFLFTISSIKMFHMKHYLDDGKIIYQNVSHETFYTLIILFLNAKTAACVLSETSIFLKILEI